MKRLLLRLLDTAGASDGDVPTYDPATDRYVPAAPAASAGAKVAALKYAGALNVGVGATRLYNDTGAAWTITSVRASVETAPSGGQIVVDVNVGGTTIFTTQANRPTIATGALTSGKGTTMDVTSVPAGGYLTVDVDATTTPAANLTVLVGIT